MRKKLIILTLLSLNLIINNSKGVIHEFYFNPNKILQKPKDITIIDGNKKVMKIKTRANYVWEVLQENNIKINKKDRITPHPRANLNYVREIRIDRIEEKTVKDYITTSYDIIFKVKYSKEYKEKVVNRGKSGKIYEEWLLLYKNGKLESKTLKTRKVLVKSEPEIIEINSPIIRCLNITEGTFKLKKVYTMTATAYYPWEGKGVDDSTALGWKAEKGIVAVDPRIIPLRTPLYIPSYGFSIAGDTGGAIKRYRIDLLLPTKREVYNFGRRKVAVYILEKIN
ncbi:MAG: hypothetical protein CBR30_05130 [Dictyoglomus sp. NZ13-RE01]|nr:MAG: hypothetical protein CBR30_05130 [Dictyoglomus sp. NZ13-RE01]